MRQSSLLSLVFSFIKGKHWLRVLGKEIVSLKILFFAEYFILYFVKERSAYFKQTTAKQSAILGKVNSLFIARQ